MNERIRARDETIECLNSESFVMVAPMVTYLVSPLLLCWLPWQLRNHGCSHDGSIGGSYDTSQEYSFVGFFGCSLGGSCGCFLSALKAAPMAAPVVPAFVDPLAAPKWAILIAPLAAPMVAPVVCWLP